MLQKLKELNQTYRRSVNMEFHEILTNDTREHSVEDKLFLQMVSSITSKQQFSRSSASKIAKKETHTEFQKDYNTFIQSLMDKGFAEKVPESELDRLDGKTWYLPHHGVYHMTKKKIRVVFHCSSRYQVISLNDKLLQGHDLTYHLIAVLLRFLQEIYAITADIEMFYKFHVAPKDRDCLRYFWWPQENLDQQPHVYRMAVHLYVAMSSPAYSNYALKHTIQDH